MLTILESLALHSVLKKTEKVQVVSRSSGLVSEGFLHMQFAQCGLQRAQACQSSLTHSSKSALLGMTHLQGVYAAMYHAGDVQDFCRKTGAFLESWPKAQAWAFHSGGGAWVIFKNHLLLFPLSSSPLPEK